MNYESKRIGVFSNGWNANHIKMVVFDGQEKGDKKEEEQDLVKQNPS